MNRSPLNRPAIGLAVREENRLVLSDPLITAAEITFERADDPLRLTPYLDPDDFEHVSVHALKLSVASADPPRSDYIDALVAVAAENNAESISDHLGFTRNGDGGAEIGHFSICPFTQPALDTTCRNVDRVMQRIGDRRFYLENIAYFFRFEGTMSEATFLRRILESTGCGWLLDVTNVYANSLNFGFDPYEFIADVVPSADRLQMHLAGGYFNQKARMYVDSHSDPIPEAVWELYRFAVELAGDRLDAVFIERDQNFPDDAGWMDEVRRAHTLATCMGAAP